MEPTPPASRAGDMPSTQAGTARPSIFPDRGAARLDTVDRDPEVSPRPSSGTSHGATASIVRRSTLRHVPTLPEGISLHLGHTSNLQQPLLDETVRAEPLYPKDAIEMLDRAYEGQPEERSVPAPLTAALMQAPADQALSPELTLALHDMVRRAVVPRPLLELAITGQAGAGFPFNFDPLIRRNTEQNGYPSYSNANVQAAMMHMTANALSRQGYIPKDARVLEAGAGLGYLSYVLKGWCRAVTALDLMKPPAEFMESMPGLDFVESSIEDFSTSHAQERFDVVLAGNFSVNAANRQEWRPKVQSYLQSASRATEDNGTFIAGINSINPLYVTPGQPEDLIPLFEEFFANVDIVWATSFAPEFGARGSVGGMMCFVVATGPKQAGGIPA